MWTFRGAGWSIAPTARASRRVAGVSAQLRTAAASADSAKKMTVMREGAGVSAYAIFDEPFPLP